MVAAARFFLSARRRCSAVSGLMRERRCDVTHALVCWRGQLRRVFGFFPASAQRRLHSRSLCLSVFHSLFWLCVVLARPLYPGISVEAARERRKANGKRRQRSCVWPSKSVVRSGCERSQSPVWRKNDEGTGDPSRPPKKRGRQRTPATSL